MLASLHARCAQLKQHPPIRLQLLIHMSSHHVLLQLLVLSTAAHGELEVAGSASQLAVDLGVGVKTVVNTTSLLLVQHNLQDLAAVLLGSQSLADDLDWVDDISQDSIVDSSQSSGSWSLLRLAGSRSVRSLGSWENSSRGEEDDVSVRELLLEFPGESLLHLVEVGEERYWDEDHDCALAMANFELQMLLDFCVHFGGVAYRTSRADWICRGRRDALRSGMLVSSSYRAVATLVSSSEG